MPPENLPNGPDGNGEGAWDGDFRALRVDNFHYKANDLTELRRLAETSPELANKVVETRDRMHRRENNSYMLGLIVTSVVAIALICTAGAALIFLGWWQSLLAIGCILAGSHFLRVFLTGEWSETSWFGKLFDAQAKRDRPTE